MKETLLIHLIYLVIFFLILWRQVYEMTERAKRYVEVNAKHTIPG